MNQIRLDLSPMLVNRTAAYNLCQDVRRIVTDQPDLQHNYQFFGRKLDEIPNGKTAATYRDAFFRALGEGGFAPQEFNLWGDCADREQTLYMDPLYVLFGQLRKQDTVMLLDLSPITHPQWHAPHVSVAYDCAMQRILQVRPSLAAISLSTIDTFLANYGDYGAPIRHVPLYAPEFIRLHAQSAHKLHTPWKYFLFVGSLEARKNMPAAIRAFEISDLAQEDYRLLIIGGRGHGADEIQRMANGSNGIVVADYLTDDDVCAAYAGAAGFVYPSYLEGFGVPLLEAMTFGIPSVASTTGACPEVAGPDVPLVDPDDHIALAGHMRDIAEMDQDKRNALGSRLRARAETAFSYNNFARNIQQMVAA